MLLSIVLLNMIYYFTGNRKSYEIIWRNLFVINFYLSYTVIKYTTKYDEDTAELMELKKLLCTVILVIRHSYSNCDIKSTVPLVNLV